MNQIYILNTIIQKQQRSLICTSEVFVLLEIQIQYSHLVTKEEGIYPG